MVEPKSSILVLFIVPEAHNLATEKFFFYKSNGKDWREWHKANNQTLPAHKIRFPV
jgi:hypothetical protein